MITRCLNCLVSCTSDLNNKEEDLIATRLCKKRLSAEINQALEKADQLHHENEKLLQEKVATTEELLATRMYLASLENVRAFVGIQASNSLC